MGDAMYDYIPMKFYFDYKNYDGIFIHYYLEAITEERQYFRVAHSGETDFFMEDYYIDALIASMKRGSLINGLTLSELRDAYYDESDEDIACDIIGLI